MVRDRSAFVIVWSVKVYVPAVISDVLKLLILTVCEVS